MESNVFCDGYKTAILLILNRHFQGDLQLYANFFVALRRKADRQ